jgi:hypothetical protein
MGLLDGQRANALTGQRVGLSKTGVPSSICAFQQVVEGEAVVFADTGFAKQDGHPANLRVCTRGEWNVRMVVEAVLSMLTTVCRFKRISHGAWSHFRTRLA